MVNTSVLNTDGKNLLRVRVSPAVPKSHAIVAKQVNVAVLEAVAERLESSSLSNRTKFSEVDCLVMSRVS